VNVATIIKVLSFVVVAAAAYEGNPNVQQLLLCNSSCCCPTGDARWDARMAAWLLWMTSHPSHLWRSYLDLLPAESDMSCLLNFSPPEITELQVPTLQVRPLQACC
jgi:hypothetical protein